jgi:predicted porin
LFAAGTVAASPAAAQDGVELGIGGYYNTFFGVFSNDESRNDTHDYGTAGLFADGEVHFQGATTLDNGIAFGVRVELEAFQSGDQIDENYAYVEGTFGRVLFGGENTAAYLMQYGAPYAGVPINSGWITTFVPPPPGATTGFRTPALSTYVDLANDDHALTYYTPRFSGFQVGASYVPAATANGEGKNFPVYADKKTENHDQISIGANYVESFGDLDVAVAGGYRHAEAAKSGGQKDPEQYSAGLSLDIAGLTLGGSWALEDSDAPTDGWGADVGVTYSTGPWSVGITGFHSEVEGTADKEDELDSIEGAVSYAIGPGITGSLSVLYADWEPGNGEDAEGWGGILGMKIGF